LRPDAALSAAAAAVGLRLRPVAVARSEELDQALAKAAPLEGRAVIVLPDPAVIDRLNVRIAALATQHRMPSVQSFRASVEAGGLLCFGIDLFDMHRRSAHFVDKILKGAQPGELPVEQPLKFEMLINLRTARTLGITITQSMLLRADEVIE
jgi:putative ABC transport system substrate-binding protein